MTSVPHLLVLDAAIAVVSALSILREGKELMKWEQASHYLWFKPYEPTSYSTIASVVLLLISPSVYILKPLVSSLERAIGLALVTYILALLGSIIAYRLSPFHPLALYPGPLICKTTNLWTAYVALMGKSHRYYEKLHEEYGKVVRIGVLRSVSSDDSESQLTRAFGC